MILDADAKERSRLEGYLPKDEFRLYLEMGLARLALSRKNWAEAQSRYAAIVADHPESVDAPQAVYFRGVSQYSQSHDHLVLTGTAIELKEKYAGNEWQLRSIPWLDE